MSAKESKSAVSKKEKVTGANKVNKKVDSSIDSVKKAKKNVKAKEAKESVLKKSDKKSIKSDKKAVKSVSDVNKKKVSSKKRIVEENKIDLESVNELGDKKESFLQTIFLHKFSFTFLDLALFAVIIVFISCLGTRFIFHFQYEKSNILYERSLGDDADLNEFIQTYSDVVNNYYEEVDNKGLIGAAMDGMLSYLEDNYSIYMNQEESDGLNSSLSGTYKGIGILASKRVIMEVYADSPAELAGMQAGDEIVSINGTEITDDNYSEISSLIQNSGKEENSIVVLRDGEEKNFSLKVDTVTINTVGTQVIEADGKKIGYLSLSTFAEKSHEHFSLGLVKLESEEIDSLILDLRGNSGGYLEVANVICNMFLDKGKVIYSLENKKNVTEYKDKTDEKREYPIVVLVNGGTASAAEILASSLKDSYGAIIVGKTTFGKGKVQTIAQYDDSLVKYTSAKWLRPNGECIDGVGIVPDYEVSNEIKNGILYDKQLDKALELLK